jgi:carbon monoxide dehydrogenase subunit G
MEQIGPDRYKATITIRIAAITGKYEGTVEMTDKHEPSGYTLVVEGKGKPGFVKGSATVSLDDADDKTTTAVNVVGKAQVGGTIARVGQRLLGSVSKMMMDRFFTCLQERVNTTPERAS